MDEKESSFSLALNSDLLLAMPPTSCLGLGTGLGHEEETGSRQWPSFPSVVPTIHVVLSEVEEKRRESS